MTKEQELAKEQEIEALMEIVLLNQLKDCSKALSTLAVQGMVTIEEMEAIRGRIKKSLQSVTS